MFDEEMYNSLYEAAEYISQGRLTKQVSLPDGLTIPAGVLLRDIISGELDSL